MDYYLAHKPSTKRIISQFTHRSYKAMPISKTPPMIFINLACLANQIVIVLCNAPEINDSASKGKPNPIPNQKKTESCLSASPAVSDIAKIPTTNGPEQGSAMGPYKSP